MENFLQKKLNERIEKDSLRTLRQENNLIDFSSNDYLGFAKSEIIKNKIKNYLDHHPHFSLGATGSRLISGNTLFLEKLESTVAKFHNAEAGLIFNSGYDANIGLFSSVPQKGDTIISDELIHACIIDGARLSYATRYTFKHNDLDSLESKLKISLGNIFIAVESVYSMDGDEAPLQNIVNLAKKYHANVVVDEAHATGVFGKNGVGCVQKLGLEDAVFARIVTFGKALGAHGAIVLGSSQLRNYLINFARSFIYTTALPFHACVNIKFAYQELFNKEPIKALQNNIGFYNSLIKTSSHQTIKTESAIQTIIIPGNKNCKLLALKLQEKGFDVRPILAPTVPEGKERLRICLHAYNTEKEISELVSWLVG